MSDPVERVRAETGGGGADSVIVTAGAADAVDQGLACLRRGGTLVCVGMPANDRPRSSTPAPSPTTASASSAASWDRPGPPSTSRIAGLYLEGRLKLDELVTAVYPLARINEAIASMRRGEAIRNVIVP